MKGFQLRTLGVFLFLTSLIVTSCFEQNDDTSSRLLPDTGQVSAYTDSFGEDSDYTINPPSYTKLGSSGQVLRDSATKWAMIRDNVTGLVWENKTDDGTIHDTHNTYTWYDPNDETNGGDPGDPGDGGNTHAFIEALNAANFGGYHDWRLPTVKELSLIVHSGIRSPGPTINTTYFPNTNIPFDYWSSTKASIDSVWAVDFIDGDVFSCNKDFHCAVRAVRGSADQGELVDNGDGTVTDEKTGLMWQQGEAGNMHWEDALAYCENLILPEGGYDDWRLPNRNELLSLVDYSRYDPAIDETYFPGALSDDYWSSTTYAGYTVYAWGVDFGYGGVIWGTKSYSYDSHYVRAVRSIKVIPQESRAPTHVKTAYQPEYSWNYITWDPVPGAVKYNVYGGTNPGVKKTSECLTVTETTTYSHAGVLPGWSYYYRVAALDADGHESKLSEQVVRYVHLGPATVKIPDTGQTASYTDISGEDSDYAINPPSYTRLDANGGDLPDSAASWAMIRDNVTGLIWENKTDDGTIHDKDNAYTWHDPNYETGSPNTKDFIEALNAANFGGYHDWRLPTVQELSWIINSDMPYPGPAINTAYFPNTQPSSYWSSIPSGVDFYYGRVIFDDKFMGHFVRAVRGSTAQRELVDNGDGTVTDTATGLMWQQGEAGRMPWEEAIAYCENLVFPEGGYDDWRLPNRNELQSLVDYSRRYPAIDQAYFPGALSYVYWSSTTLANLTGSAWTIYFYYGYVGYYDKSYSYSVRAVRGGE